MGDGSTEAVMCASCVAALADLALLHGRMRDSKILIAGMNGLGAEVCKNLVLAGIGELQSLPTQ